MKLPDKRTYTLEQLAHDWNCEVKEILQFWVEDKLHLCVLFVPPVLGRIVTPDISLFGPIRDLPPIMTPMFKLE